MLLALVLLFSCLPPAVVLGILATHRTCYVKPENSSEPCLDPCFSLQEYAENGTGNCSFSRGNTTFLFLNGVHVLIKNISIDVMHADSVYLVGNVYENGSKPEILCHKEAGFLFHNASNLAIRHLVFTRCGHWYFYMVLEGQATLAFNDVVNVSLDDVVVTKSTGYGIYALCPMGYVEVVNCEFSYNNGTEDYDGGNAGFLYQNCTDVNFPSLLYINSTQFLYGYSNHINPLATGLSVFVWLNGVNVDINNITAVGNEGGHRATGGNVALLLRNRSNLISNWVKVSNSHIAEGKAFFGAGMFVSILDTPSIDARANKVRYTLSNDDAVLASEIITISNTTFSNNDARWEGGGLYIITHEEDGVFYLIGNITVFNCSFHNNSLSNGIGGGVAIHLANHYVLSYVKHSVPQFQISIINCTIQGSRLIVEESFTNFFTGSGAVFVIQNPSGVLFHDCHFLDNKCTAMTTVWSSAIFGGNVTFSGNEGTDGGGIILCDNSYMLLRANTTVVFTENKAQHAGGGIYAENACLQSEPPCFFQLHLEIYETPELVHSVHVHLINNSAKYAGSAIYGGSVDYCYMFPQYVPDLNGTGSVMFEIIFEIDEPSADLSSIASNPFRLCFCNKTLLPNCSIYKIDKEPFPGQEFFFYGLTVGQKEGSAPGTVIASLQNDDSHLANLQDSQLTQQSCTRLNYTVFSNYSLEVIILTVQHSDLNIGAHSIPSIEVDVVFKQCPLGFSIADKPPYKCTCVDTLAAHDIVCDINEQTIRRVVPNWIGYDYQIESDGNKTDEVVSGIVFLNHCPFDYCKMSTVYIKTGLNISEFHGDEQCAFHRKGVLCGACKEGYSLIIGCSECKKCSDIYILLIAVFLVAGFALVFLLVAFNLNVSTGTLSGLIFYANIVQVNRAIFFSVSPMKIPLHLCSIFIAWLNLDFGIETCFYNGMDAYAKTWLQFAFPLYVWAIAAVIVLLGRKYPSVAGRNPIQVLASLFHLSFAKLLRTIIASLSPALLQFPAAGNGTVQKVVWLEDGNVGYFEGKHIVLIIVAVGFGLMALPYATILLLIQWLQKGSHLCLCSWVAKFKPLFDAYTAPYKRNCRFWTGFLLLVRFGLFSVFTLPFVDPELKLTLIVSTCIVVQVFAWSFHGVYESQAIDIINSLSILNLGLFSAATNCLLTNGGDQAIAVYISVGFAWTLFSLIFLYHGSLSIRNSEKWLNFQLQFREKLRSVISKFSSDHIQDGNGAATGRQPIDQFDTEYREPLISSSSFSYGANAINS